MTPILRLICLFALLFIASPVVGGTRDSLYTIELKGKVNIPDADDLKSYCVELFYGNVLVETESFRDGEAFLLRLKQNTQYTVRILKPGYLPMVVTIDTRLQEEEAHRYRFDTDFFAHQYGFNLSLTVDNPLEFGR